MTRNQRIPGRLGESFAHSPHPMWVFDQETLAFLEVNDAAVRRYDYTREEFLGMTILDIRPVEDVQMLVNIALRPPPPTQRPNPRPTLETPAQGRPRVLGGNLKGRSALSRPPCRSCPCHRGLAMRRMRCRPARRLRPVMARQPAR